MNCGFKNIMLIVILLLVFTGHTKAQDSYASHLITVHRAGLTADSNMMVHPVIVGPTIELALSRTLSWTTCLQYNTQFKNFNLGSRLQWRYRLRSEMYLQYTDNYLADGGPHREKNIELKISYQIN